jgi:hypothetical protein
MLITDRDETNPIFQDAEIDAFLDMNDDSIRLAAASALETIATDQALVLKVLVTLDLETDGAKVADSLMKRAASLRAQEESVGAFDVAEMVVNNFSERERLYNEILREGV